MIETLSTFLRWFHLSLGVVAYKTVMLTLYALLCIPALVWHLVCYAIPDRKD